MWMLWITELDSVTNVSVCPFCYFVRNPGKYFEREGGTYSFPQPQYSHTSHLKEYNLNSNYSVRIQLRMSLRIRAINACISLEILVSIFTFIFSLVDYSSLIFLIWFLLLLSVCRFQVWFAN